MGEMMKTCTIKGVTYEAHEDHGRACVAEEDDFGLCGSLASCSNIVWKGAQPKTLGYAVIYVPFAKRLHDIEVDLIKICGGMTCTAVTGSYIMAYGPLCIEPIEKLEFYFKRPASAAVDRLIAEYVRTLLSKGEESVLTGNDQGVILIESTEEKIMSNTEKVDPNSFQVGDTVYCAAEGRGRVTEIRAGSIYPVRVARDGCTGDYGYTPDGKYFNSLQRTLFFAPIETNATHTTRPRVAFAPNDVVFNRLSGAIAVVSHDHGGTYVTCFVGGGSSGSTYLAHHNAVTKIATLNKE